jgi:hypothetical protein
MAGQLNSFVHKFYTLWNTGNDACLNLECHAGIAKIHLQLNLQLQPHLQPQQRQQPPPPPQQPRRHLGPSQLRRRARRELARAAAAEAAGPAAENADADAVPALPRHQEPLASADQPEFFTAERADNNSPHHAPAPPQQATAAQAVPQPAEQAQPPPNEDPQHAAAVQAGHLPAEQAQFPPQPPQVCDSVCPDYEALPAAQVAPHHLPLHQQDRRLTLKISARHSLLRRYGLRRAHLQQRHLQAHEAHEEPLRRQEPLGLNENDQIHTIEHDEDEPPDHQHQACHDCRHPHLGHQQETYEDGHGELCRCSICRLIQCNFSDANFCSAMRKHFYSNFAKLTPDIGWPTLTYDDEEHEHLPAHEPLLAPLQ